LSDFLSRLVLRLFMGILPFRDEWLTAARLPIVRVTPLGEMHSRCQSTHIRKSLTDRNLGAIS
jgi:hypothetical protein